MLIERLTERKLFEKEDKVAKQAALALLNTSVRNLVGAMSSIEREEVMTRDEIENIVLKRLQHFEVMLYSMTDEEFADWQEESLIRKRYWEMRKGEENEG